MKRSKTFSSFREDTHIMEVSLNEMYPQFASDCSANLGTRKYDLNTKRLNKFAPSFISIHLLHFAPYVLPPSTNELNL